MGLERRDGIGETLNVPIRAKKKKKKTEKINFKKAICLAARITGEAAVCCAAGAGLPGGRLELLCPRSGQIPAGIPGGLRDGVCAENGSVPRDRVPWVGKCFPSPFHPYPMGAELCWGVCKPSLGFRCVNAVHPAAGGVLSCSAPEEPCPGCFQILQHTKLSSLALPYWLFLQQPGPVFSYP